MKLTKYGHACFTVEKQGKTIVVDPGVYTDDLDVIFGVVGVVITHQHADHFDTAALGALVANNPDLMIYAPSSVTAQLEGALPVHTVIAGDTQEVGPFSLRFFGGNHATIHPDMAPIDNVGVLIDDSLYYPGDSLAVPGVPVSVLALPVAAPWLKISETIDFLRAVKPRSAFPTHDAIFSAQGKQLVDRMLTAEATAINTTYRRIDTPIEL